MSRVNMEAVARNRRAAEEKGNVVQVGDSDVPVHLKKPVVKKPVNKKRARGKKRA